MSQSIMGTTTSPEFKLKEYVYHATPESKMGIVLNTRYYPHTGHWEYFVSWSAVEADWYIGSELTETQVF